MLHVALLGYGKMGKAIEKILLEKGHHVVLKIHEDSLELLTSENIRRADVAIEFSTPDSARKNILFCFENGVPVVSGTTGWTEHLPDIEDECRRLNGTFLYASNFSVGVNLFFELNKKLAELMNRRPEYEVHLREVHHLQKKDAPSGTALTLAHQIIDANDQLEGWINEESDDKTVLSIISERQNQVPGTHSVRYLSDIDDIEIVHTAHTREGFARGAVLAAEYIADKKGIFSMPQVLF